MMTTQKFGDKKYLIIITMSTEPWAQSQLIKNIAYKDFDDKKQSKLEFLERQLEFLFATIVSPYKALVIKNLM